MTLSRFFAENPRVALAFSGGTDSSYLLCAAVDAGADVAPYYISTAFQPAFELEDARRLCDELGVALKVVELDVLSSPEVAANPANRCLYCKRALFSALRERIARDGYQVLLDGTNASDDAGDRPGMQALRELKVRSPLQECGITNDMVRTLARERGLFVWDKPSYACLATRIPTGRTITGEPLNRVDAAENILFRLGFRDFRVRLYGEAARLQLTPEDFTRAAERKQTLLRELSPLFDAVLLDLKTG